MSRKAQHEQEEPQQEQQEQEREGVSTPDPDNQSGGFRTREPDTNRETRENAEREVAGTPGTGPDAGPPISSPADADPTGQGKLEPGTPLGPAGPGFGDKRGPAGVDPNEAAAETDVNEAAGFTSGTSGDATVIKAGDSGQEQGDTGQGETP